MSVTGVANTPSASARVATPDTLAALDLPRILDLVACHAVSDLGAAAVRARVPSPDVEWVREELATVRELAAALRGDAPFSPVPVPDLTAVLETLDTPGGVLDAEGLLGLAGGLHAMREVRAGLARLERDAPRAAALAVDVPPGEIGARVTRSIAPDGTVTDDASRDVARARRRVRDVRARLIQVLERHARQLGEDGGVTMRGGRYVIPVRKDARARSPGIVHGESSSGATLFVEPVDAVEHGNDLAGAEAEEARAVLAVLRELTETARPHRDAIGAGWSMCVRADDLYARARYALGCDAALPAIGAPGSPLVVRRGFHPLVLAEGAGAVPFDLELEDGARTLLVSGPNAGGKSVLLKAVGSLAVLAQSGIVPPVGEGTRLPAFTRVFADIGDRQSIAQSLSTFSGHLQAMRGILSAADAGSLVLLDEIGGGTDPLEGAALAGAVLLSLNQRGCVTVATTHLSDLKDLAARSAGFVNASLRFDTDTLAPTYQFQQGQPGRSYGIAIARRLGLPAAVLDRADELLPEGARSLEAVLAELEARDADLRERLLALEAAEAEVAALREAAGRERASLERRDDALRERERTLEREGREQARRFLLEARRRVEEALGLARAAVTEATAKEARRLVEEGVQGEAEALKRLQRKGWKVLGTDEGGVASRAPRPAPRTPPSPPTASPLTAARTEVDLRGMTGDEAEAAVVAAVDGAVVDELPWIRIIHGKGGGVLRARVDAVLRQDPRVASHRAAPPEQAGTGVTIAELAP